MKINAKFVGSAKQQPQQQYQH